jgi:hypothetical protein
MRAADMDTKQYLGDGVYVDLVPESRSIVLTVEDGVWVTNTIFLEPIVIAALRDYLKGTWK